MVTFSRTKQVPLKRFIFRAKNACLQFITEICFSFLNRLTFLMQSLSNTSLNTLTFQDKAVLMIICFFFILAFSDKPKAISNPMLFFFPICQIVYTFLQNTLNPLKCTGLTFPEQESNGLPGYPDVYCNSYTYICFGVDRINTMAVQN